MSQQKRFSTMLALLFLVGCTNNQADQASNAGPQGLAAFKTTPEARKSDRAYAYLDAVREDLSRGKVQIITAVMNLSPDEGKTFWPIYHTYEEEMFALGDQRMELTRKFVSAVQEKSMDDAKAQQLGNAWWDYESQRLALVKKYYDRIQKEISPLRAAQFAQIEHRVAVVIDLMVASELPLIEGSY
jgi:hypothetical protein